MRLWNAGSSKGSRPTKSSRLSSRAEQPQPAASRAHVRCASIRKLPNGREAGARMTRRTSFACSQGLSSVEGNGDRLERREHVEELARIDDLCGFPAFREVPVAGHQEVGTGSIGSLQE